MQMNRKEPLIVTATDSRLAASNSLVGYYYVFCIAFFFNYGITHIY